VGVRRSFAEGEWRLRGGGDAEVVEQAADAAFDLAAHWADVVHALARRVVGFPVQVPLSGVDRAGVAAAHGDDHVDCLDDLVDLELGNSPVMSMPRSLIAAMAEGLIS
jgi:hypothetical protein